MKEKYFNQPSVTKAQSHFSQVPSADIKRSKFDRSHACKTTFDAGQLIPIFCDEVLPGDTFHMNATAFARLATPLKPVMDNMFLDIHFFFVPCRLVWENWQKFMGERPTPDFDPNTLSIPQVEIPLEETSDGNKLHEYFGLPCVRDAAGDALMRVNALPFRAYYLIFNEWYRDQNLQEPAPLSIDDGPDSYIGIPGPRGKRHDYFTSCLPWPQKGDAVTIPLGELAPLTGTGTVPAEVGGSPGVNDAVTTATGTGLREPFLLGDGVAFDVALMDNTLDLSGVSADLSSATAVSINDFRLAVTIQRLLERDARGGTRYIELILSHFGVRSDDARLQRPEYLGGGTSAVNLSPIAATVAQESVPQANLSAVGTSLNRNAGFTKSFSEHGYIIGIVSARADLTYQRGIERMWSRETRNEFYWPTFANLGEQAVLNKEIYFQSIPAQDDAVFGYQERFGEYRYKPSRITGLFNSDVTSSLDVWHLAQDFETLPVLNSSFIMEQPPIDRIIAVPSEPHFLLDVWFDLKCDRPMPIYSVPGLDHL